MDAFCYIDSHQVFQKSGPFPENQYELTSIIGAVLPYSSKLASRMLNQDIYEKVPVANFTRASSLHLVYRRKEQCNCFLS